MEVDNPTTAPKAEADSRGAPAAATSSDVKQDAAGQSAAAQSDVKQAADASTAGTTDVKTASDASTEAGDKASQPDTLASQIEKGLEKMRKKADTTDSPPAETSEKGKEGEAEADPEDPESDVEKSAPEDVKKHPAFKQVLNERKQARRERNKFQKELDAVKGEATQYKQIRTFLDSNGISDKDAAQALKLTALIYTKPREAYSELKKLVDQLAGQVGEVLPADLQKEVDEGIIPADRAAELARTRADVNLAKAETLRVQERTKQVDADQEMQYRAQLYDNWAGQTAKTDPDLQKKLPMITARLTQMLATEGDPKSPEDAWNRLNRAHADATAYVKAFQPARQPVQPSPQSTGNARHSNPKPATFEEAMAAGIDKLLTGSRS